MGADILIVVGVLLVVLILFGTVAAVMLNTEAERQKRTLSVIKGQTYDDGDGDKKKKEAQNKRRDEIAKKLKGSEGQGDGDKKKKKGSIPNLIMQSGLPFTSKQYWMFSLVMGVVCVVAAKILGLSNIVALLAAVTGFLGIPRFLLKTKIKKRQKQFLEEFADALEAMVRLLKAGMPVTEAISMASKEYTGPVGEEMSRIYEAQKVGISMPEASLMGAQRMPLTEMQMFATGIAIQVQTGASLSEVLQNLANVIRARFRLKRKVQALSSEAKASAMIIGSLPFLVGGGLFAINQAYIEILFTTLPGKIMLVVGAVWMSLGILVMKVMINFKI